MIGHCNIKRTFLLAAAVMTVTAMTAETLSFSGRGAATVGIKIVELSTGRTVESENEEVAMIPASILKAVTTASAINNIGCNFRFQTPVEMTGTFDGRTLDGDVVVRASGDPTISSKYFPSTAGMADSIVARLRGLGVRTIAGDVYVDEDNFSNPGQNPQWVIEDAGWAYGAGLYGFNYCDNIFNLYTEDSRTVPEVPDIDVFLEKTTSSADIIHGVNSDNYFISGKDVEKKGYYVTSTMNSPAAVFVNELKKKITAAGIAIKEENISPSDKRTRIYTQRSPVASDIMKSLMFRSDNMMAEAILRAQAQGRSRKTAVDAEMSCLRNLGVATSYTKIFDGSGLARADRVTAKFMADILVAMARGGNAATYVAMFPKAGKEGTVKSLLRRTALDGRIALKSGSMNGVHCYAGYKLGSNGKPTHAVVIMVNNFFCSRDALKKEIQRYLLAVFK